MPRAQAAQQTNEPAHQSHKTEPTTQEPVAPDIFRFGVADPRAAQPSGILALQRTVSNCAIGNLIQAKPFVNSSPVPVQRLTVLVSHVLALVERGFWSR